MTEEKSAKSLKRMPKINEHCIFQSGRSEKVVYGWETIKKILHKFKVFITKRF